MKKIMVLLCLLLAGLSVKAEISDMFETNVNMTNFWIKNGIYEEKILDVGTKILNKNKINKHIVFVCDRNTKVINAYASSSNKSVHIFTGLLPYLDSDDELAYIMSHEIAHSLDQYDGFMKAVFLMRLNSKQYEYKADLIGVDLMVKAGYNPVAALTASKKINKNSLWDLGFGVSHPNGTKRQMAMYKYIYRKYPWALKTDMIHNVNYENFLYANEEEINDFILKDKLRQENKGEDL